MFGMFFKILFGKICHALLEIFEEFVFFKKLLNNEIEISLSEPVKRAVQLLQNYAIMYNNIEYYLHGHKPTTRRIFLVSFIQIIVILYLVRLLFMAVSDNPVLEIVFNDFLNQLCDRKSSMILSLLAASLAFMVIIYLALFNFYELTNRLKFLRYLNDLIENKPAIELSYSRHRRLTLGLYLMTKYVFHFVYRFIVLITVITYTIFSFMYSPDRGSVLSNLFAVLWLIPTYISFMVFISTLYLCAIISIFCMFYVKYAFNTIEDDIKLCLKCRNSKLVIKAINKHRIAVKMCEDMNDFFKTTNFILYFMASPCNMTNMYFITDENNPMNLRIIAAFVSIISYSIVVSLILINTQITESAHRPRKYLYRYLDNNSLPFKRRMKIMAFIEILSGQEIGFYCWDWFPLNTFEFYQYCAFCVSFYLMVSGFLS